MLIDFRIMRTLRNQKEEHVSFLTDGGQHKANGDLKESNLHYCVILQNSLDYLSIPCTANFNCGNCWKRQRKKEKKVAL